MPYMQFTKTISGKKKWCTRNKDTGKVVCYSTPTKRIRGIAMREAIRHGFVPTGAKGKGRIKKMRILK